METPTFGHTMPGNSQWQDRRGRPPRESSIAVWPAHVEILWIASVALATAGILEIVSHEGFSHSALSATCTAYGLAGITLYNWEYGHNQGHKAHRYNMYLYSIYCVASFCHTYQLIDSRILNVITGLTLLGVGGVFVLNWRDLLSEKTD
jgi:hypothetical protein